MSIGNKVVFVVLCRNRGPLFVTAIAAAIRKRSASVKMKTNVIIYEKGTKTAQNLSERSLMSGACSIIIYPCDSSAVNLNVGFIDLLICCDEGSSLQNIYRLASDESTKECVNANIIKGAQLCMDNPQLFPSIAVPEVVEYWAVEDDGDSGMLSTLERMAFEDRLESDGQKGAYKEVIKSTRELLSLSMDKALLWQDRPQRIVNTAHSTATLTLTKIISADQRELCEQMNRLRRRAINEKWLDDGPDSKTGKCEEEQTTLGAKRHIAEVMGPPTGKAKRARPSRTPPVLRIDSASFGLLIKKPPKLSAASFVNRIVETSAYCERRKQMAEVLDKLRALLRV